MTYKAELNPIPSNAQAYRLVLFDEQKQPIGYAIGELRQYAMWYDGQPYFFLTSLSITNPVYRQQGLGNQLLKAVELFARKEGAYWVRGQLETKPVDYINTPADERALKTFWTKNGYGLKQEIFEDSIRFWKPLHRRPAC